MLRVFLDNTSDNIKKRLGLTQAFTKKGLEFIPGNRDVGLIFKLPLVLLLAKQSGILDKDGGKYYPILNLSHGGNKMFFTLLKEVIAL